MERIIILCLQQGWRLLRMISLPGDDDETIVLYFWHSAEGQVWGVETSTLGLLFPNSPQNQKEARNCVTIVILEYACL